MIAVQKIIYNASGGVVDEEVEWKNLDSFGLSDLRTRKKGLSSQVTGITFSPMGLNMAGIELESRLTTGGGSGGTIDPEIPVLHPDQGDPVGGVPTNSDTVNFVTGGNGIVPLCVLYGSIVVKCSRPNPLGILVRNRRKGT